MSGSVFVQDAEGRPLMPTAPAYARTLVRDGKAILVSHPALSIVQLTHVVTEPTLHPVLVAIRVREPGASLLVFTERTGLAPLLHLAVAFQPPDQQPSTMTSDLWLIRRKLVKATLEAIASLLTILPISHIIGDSTEPTTPDSVLDLLLHHLRPFPCQVWDAHTGMQLEQGGPLPLYTAWSTTARISDISEASLLAWCEFPLPNEPPKIIAQVKAGTQFRTGLLSPTTEATEAQLYIPTAVSWQGVIWQQQWVAADMLQRSWPLEHLAFLPIANKKADIEHP